MLERILIIIGAIILVFAGTYLIHWLLNAQEWVDMYIHRTRPDLLKKRKQGKRAAVKKILKKHKVVAKAVSTRDRVIELLAKDKPQQAPIFIYILMSSLLIFNLAGLLILGYMWTQLR